MLPPAREIYVEQTLHGYMEGHRLLASSAELPKPALRTMLVLSDMSGSNVAPGFESYVTGYPVDETDFYAFARTWYAHEMNRPGCAWTHTLLIRTKDIGEIPCLDNLVIEFRRPQGAQVVTGSYEKRIWLSPTLAFHAAYPSHSSACLHGPVVSQLVKRLYGDPKCPPILLLCDHSRECEDLILSLWSQQWPALRRYFTFCSGSLANRLIAEKPFDLQAIPRKIARSIEREVPTAYSIDIGNDLPDETGHTWVATVTKDITSDKPTAFRRYLWAVGEQSHPTRSDLHRLANLYGVVQRVNEHEALFETLLSELAAHYPDAEDGVAVKAAILGPSTNGRSTLIENISESDMLCALAHFDRPSALSAESLQLRSRAQALWHEDAEFQGCVRRLLTTHVNPLGEELLAGVADVISPAELVRFSRGDHRLVFAFVERKPALVYGRELWAGEPDYQRELFDHVRHAPVASDMVQAMVRAMLEARVDVVAPDVYAHLGTPVLRVFLDWYSDRTETQIEGAYRSWIGLIGKAPGETLDWLRSSGHWRAGTLRLIASELDPHSPVVQAHGTELWRRIVDALEHSMDDKTRRALAEFLLPFSLEKHGPDSERLARFAFPIIHEALATNSLSYKAWRHLDPILPRLSWWNSWDKCERLRRSMKQAGFELTVERWKGNSNSGSA
jgi:hypothetical protein